MELPDNVGVRNAVGRVVVMHGVGDPMDVGNGIHPCPFA